MKCIRRTDSTVTPINHIVQLGTPKSLSHRRTPPWQRCWHWLSCSVIVIFLISPLRVLFIHIWKKNKSMGPWGRAGVSTTRTEAFPLGDDGRGAVKQACNRIILHTTSVTTHSRSSCHFLLMLNFPPQWLNRPLGFYKDEATCQTQLSTWTQTVWIKPSKLSLQQNQGGRYLSLCYLCGHLRTCNVL